MNFKDDPAAESTPTCFEGSKEITDGIKGWMGGTETTFNCRSTFYVKNGYVEEFL